MFYATFILMWLFVRESTAQSSWTNEVVTRNSSDAAAGQFPHQASVQYRRRHRCGGSVVAKRFVLTSAYCVAMMDKDNVTAVLGLNSLDDVGTSYQADSIITHEDYNPKTRLNDIALVKLKKDIVMSGSVKPMGFAKREPNEGQNLTVSGWPDYSWPSNGWQNNLQILQTKFMSLEVCKKKLKYSGTWGQALGESQLCAASGLNHAPCTAESGSALLTAEGKQVGISSWARPCSPELPYVYTKITKYVSWIENKIAKSKNE